jgi:hypothetical protein
MAYRTPSLMMRVCLSVSACVSVCLSVCLSLSLSLYLVVTAASRVQLAGGRTDELGQPPLIGRVDILV